MRTIKAAVIGAGFIGPAHVEALRRLGFVEVAALVDADKPRLEQKAAALAIPRAYDDYRRVLDDKDIEVVHNCSPNNVHFEINSAILNAGKHCVSEKPLAMNTKESKALVDLAKKTGLVNAINFCYRFYPLSQQAKAMCDAGEIGDLFAAHGSYLQDWLFFETDYSWRLEPEMSGESCCVADIGSHWCDLVQFITGRRIVEVMGDLQTTFKTRKRPKAALEAFAGKILTADDYENVPIKTDDYANVLVRFDNGARGVFSVSQVSAGRKNRLYYEIDGSKCALSGDLERPNELWIGYRNKANEVMIKDPSLLKPEVRSYAHYPGGHPEGYPDGPKNLFRNAYLTVMGDKNALPFPTFEDGHRAVAIVDAVVASSRSSKWTKVAY
jgi:predicted dehydrogenase